MSQKSEDLTANNSEEQLSVIVKDIKVMLDFARETGIAIPDQLGEEISSLFSDIENPNSNSAPELKGDALARVREEAEKAVEDAIES